MYPPKIIDNKKQDMPDQLKGLANRHRKTLWVLGSVLALYTVLGFFFVPWLVEKIAVDTVSERYAAELRMERVAFNPYALSLQIDGLSMQGPDGAPFVGADQIYVNLQLSSLFRLAATFAEIRLDAPEIHLSRSSGGVFNAGFLANTGDTEPPEEPEETGMLRLIVQQLTINEAAFNWNDAVPLQPVVTRLGPVNVSVQNLNTLPQREGQQDVVITTETAGTLSWSGSLQLNPLKSLGSASVKGSHMSLISAYIRDQLGFEIVRGEADVGFDYQFSAESDDGIEASIDNFSFALSDILVRTFGAATSAGDPNDRDVLAVADLGVRGGTLRWPERSMSFDEVVIADTTLSIHRDSAGKLNVVSQRDAEAVPEEEADAQGGEESAPWSIDLGRLAVDAMAIGLIDDSVQPQADMGIDELSVVITGISSEPGRTFPTELNVLTRMGGTVRVTGEIGLLPEPVSNLAIQGEGLALAESHPYLTTLADVNLDSGLLAFDMAVSTGPDDTLAASGDVTITDFLITETDEGSRLGSWDTLLFDQVELSFGKQSLEVSEVRFDKPYADVVIAEDGSANIGRIKLGEQRPAADGDEEAAEREQASEAATDTGDDEAAFDVTIGRVTIADAAADFADFSLPLPFAAGISELNGELTTIATNSVEPSDVTMEGKVDEFGLLRVSGSLTPLALGQNTDISLRFENVEIPKFSAYTIAFAGREIASGRLDLDLGYVVTDGKLAGENRVVMRDLELGEEVEHPDAMSLPLGLAIGLLKGPDGTIDIDLPVSGNVDDPEFSYGAIIGKALVNLIVKAVASPFTLLGKLVGVEADELDHISFIAGRHDLTPPEQERIAKLAEALTLRPELVLEVAGVVDREADGLALRTGKFDAIVESRIEAPDEPDSKDAMYAEQRADVIEDLYREAGPAEGATPDELRARFTAATTNPESGRTTSSFDSLAYTAELRRLLIDRQVVTEDELVALARTRSDNVGAAIIAVDEGLAARIRPGPLEEVEATDDGDIRMDVKLTTGD